MGIFAIVIYCNLHIRSDTRDKSACQAVQYDQRHAESFFFSFFFWASYMHNACADQTMMLHSAANSYAISNYSVIQYFAASRT
jgi:hypothetical protein